MKKTTLLEKLLFIDKVKFNASWKDTVTKEIPFILREIGKHHKILPVKFAQIVHLLIL